MKNNFKLFEKFILKLSLICLIFVIFGLESKANAATDIRVGLEHLYKDKNVITIYNTSLKMGYSVNDSYKAEVILKSQNGFSFEPINSVFFHEENYYSSYSAAYKAAQNRIVDKMKPYICSCGRNKWRLYYTEKDKMPDNCVICNETGIYKITFGNKTILADCSESSAYPQFKAAGGEQCISLGTRKYRGRIEIGRYGKTTLTAVNIVNIENYLKGVVTCEMNSTWEPEALKVQAVCARSYAFAKCSFSSDTSLKTPYVINDTDSSQVYGGYSLETNASVSAVLKTKGEVLYSEGKPLITYYSSTSGGATDFSSDIWGGNSFNYIGVFDEYETEPEKRPWTVKYTKNEFEALLRNKGYSIENVTDVFPEILSDSGRVTSLKIKSSGGNVSISGSKLRSLFGLPSTKFIVVSADNYDNYSVYALDGSNNMKASQASDYYIISGQGDVSEISGNTDQMVIISDSNMTNFPLTKPKTDEIWFLGMGSGHGIGMSQSGANGMAKAGFDYKAILYYYFKDSTLGKY